MTHLSCSREKHGRCPPNRDRSPAQSSRVHDTRVAGCGWTVHPTSRTLNHRPHPPHSAREHGNCCVQPMTGACSNDLAAGALTFRCLWPSAKKLSSGGDARRFRSRDAALSLDGAPGAASLLRGMSSARRYALSGTSRMFVHHAWRSWTGASDNARPASQPDRSQAIHGYYRIKVKKAWRPIELTLASSVKKSAISATKLSTQLWPLSSRTTHGAVR